MGKKKQGALTGNRVKMPKIPRSFDPPQGDWVEAQLEHSPIVIWAHPPTKCAGQPCTLHNRSDHHMRPWMQHWRDDRGLMERICPHGIGHPDPDQWEYLVNTYGEETARAEFVHGCDGDCRKEKA